MKPNESIRKSRGWCAKGYGSLQKVGRFFKLRKWRLVQPLEGISAVSAVSGGTPLVQRRFRASEVR
jgi:hypothetical protein